MFLVLSKEYTNKTADHEIIDLLDDSPEEGKIQKRRKQARKKGYREESTTESHVKESVEKRKKKAF